MEFYLTAIMLGLCLSAMSMGIFISMKVFSIPDITTDGSYTLGAVLTAVLLTASWHPLLVIPVVIAAGACAGILTGLVHTLLKIEALLSGILVMTALYSVNLSILGRSNVPLLQVGTFFQLFHFMPSAIYSEAIAALVFIALIAALLAYVLLTDFGIAMRATGNSASMTRALGINNNRMKITGLAIANALTALSGYLVAQYQNFTDINMGIGIVITGLGSVLIGDAFTRIFPIRSIALQLMLVVSGSVIFQLVLAFTLSLGIDPNMLKLVTTLFVLLIVGLPAIKTFRRT